MVRQNGRRQISSTVLKALDILDCFATEHRPLSVSQIAEQCGLTRPTAHRLVTTLAGRGYLTTTADGRYRLGSKVLRLARGLLDYTSLPTVARPILSTLAQAVGETVYLGMLDGTEVLYLDKYETPKSARLYSVVGTRNPVYCTALGKALLAFLPTIQRDDVLSRITLIKRARNTILDPARLLAELEDIRARGYALDNVENEEGIRCIAAPILNASQYPIAAISVSGPETRLTDDRVQDVAPAVKEAATQIAAQLGFGGGA
ncbi:IclR family transcriptional regulator [Thermomicrobiaceae bacterium CFH 74404]|uniref:IclR family transcriptional regulator n=2 Tax=Thermomicrobia TaxID=189775 RepID=A0AA41WA59_9BACT|nr:IclR family transcriptional regulator [Thermalbibacter longus]MCM8748939.1 IclR family transcriptional regulator [Thermalbibacter longus]